MHALGFISGQMENEVDSIQASRESAINDQLNGNSKVRYN